MRFLFSLLSLFIACAHAQDAAKSSQHFAFDLLRQLSEKDTNLCFSPYSLSSALSMTFEGARGVTQREMERVLGFSSDAGNVSASFQQLNRDLMAANQDGTRLVIANSLWMQKGMPVLPAFLESMDTYYSAAFYSVDFQKQSESARLNINNWINQSTQGKIPNLLTPGSITSATRMVLASAIYMKARWALPFSEKQTAKQTFFGLDGVVSVPMMTHTEHYSFFEDTLAQVIDIPYSDGKLAMLCILPLRQVGLQQVEDQISPVLFGRWLRSLTQQRVRLFFPKFKVASALSLEDPLSKMGMPSAFDSSADFSGIDGEKELQISNVVHQAYIAADEAGTEAAAATAVIMNLKASLHEAEPRVLRINRPFLYIVYEKSSGAILFMGRVVNPLE